MEIQLAHLLAARENTTPLFFKRTEDVLAIENRAKNISEAASDEDDSLYAPLPTTLWGEQIAG